MPKYPIDLKESNGAGVCPPCSPEQSRPYYPTLHLNWEDEYDLPDDGILTVKFHKRHETNSSSDDGTTRQSVELEITSIESVESAESDEPKKSDRDEASEALDKYAAEADSE